MNQGSDLKMPANVLFLLSIRLPSICQHLGKHPRQPNTPVWLWREGKCQVHQVPVQPKQNANEGRTQGLGLGGGEGGAGRWEQRVGSTSTQKDSHGISAWKIRINKLSRYHPSYPTCILQMLPRLPSLKIMLQEECCLFKLLNYVCFIYPLFACVHVCGELLGVSPLLLPSRSQG